jgi:hypothetical protein
MRSPSLITTMATAVPSTIGNRKFKTGKRIVPSKSAILGKFEELKILINA